MPYSPGEHAASGSRLTGCLNLVDLAGSERVGRSGAEVRRAPWARGSGCTDSYFGSTQSRRGVL